MAAKMTSSTGPAMVFRLLSIFAALALALWIGATYGRLDEPGPLVWMLGLFGLQFVRLPAVIARSRTQTSAVFADRRDTLAVIGYSIGVVAVPLFWVMGFMPSLAPLHQPVWMVGLGAVTAGAAAVLCWRAHADLKQQWSSGLELVEGHELVTAGVYARIRHPMYLAFLLGAVSQALLLPDLVAGLSGLVGMAVLLGLRLPLEEKMLADTFGARWIAHSAATGLLWPRLGSRPA